MIHINPIQNTPELQADIKPIIDRVKAVLQRPRLSINPTTPPVIQVTKELLEAIGTKEYPAEPITVIPGLLVQAYNPEKELIISLLFEPKQPIKIMVHALSDDATYEAPTIIEK